MKRDNVLPPRLTPLLLGLLLDLLSQQELRLNRLDLGLLLDLLSQLELRLNRLVLVLLLALHIHQPQQPLVLIRSLPLALPLSRPLALPLSRPLALPCALLGLLIQPLFLQLRYQFLRTVIHQHRPLQAGEDDAALRLKKYTTNY